MEVNIKNDKPICLKHPTDKYKTESIPLQNGQVLIVSYPDNTIVVNVQENNKSKYIWCNKPLKQCDIQDNDNYILVEVVK